MKNIHVLPTDKPSRIIKSQDNDFILLNTNVPNWFEINLNTTKQNIYITSDEEIKEGDYSIAYSVTSDKKPYILCASEYKERKKEKGKIILTTDLDLIKDGVQAIDDEFLEWFVKNPSCEKVEVSFDFKKFRWSALNKEQCYKIIIPKEEPKQETLEEAAKKYSENWEETTGLDYENTVPSEVNKLDFINGAKWQSERMYSEEDIIDLIQFLSMNKEFNEYSSVSKETARYFLEQFKKK